MTANPLMTRQAQHGGSRMSVEEQVTKLNNYNWIAQSGKLYFINTRTMANGHVERFVDRAT